MASSFAIPTDNPTAVARANSKFYSPVSPTVGANPSAAPPTAAAAINPPIGWGFAGGKDGLNKATAAGQIQSGQLHTDVANFHQYYDTLTPEQKKVFAPNTTDPKGANYVNPVAGGNVAPGVRTADNLEGITKENARQHFMRTLQLGQNAPAGPAPAPQSGAATLDNPVIGNAAMPAAQAINPPIGQNAFDAHKGYQDQLSKLDEAKAAGTSVEGLAAQKVQAQAAQAQDAEAQKAKDQIYNKTQSGIDLNEARAEEAKKRGGYYENQGKVVGQNANTRAQDVAQKPEIAGAKNASAESVAKIHAQAQKDIADAKAQAASTGKAPDYTKVKTTIDKTEGDWEKNYRQQYEKERVAGGDRNAENEFRDRTIAEHRKLTESRYPEVYGQKPAAATQPALKAPKPGTVMVPGQHEDEAKAFLAAAGGDATKARALAEQHGWQFGMGGQR